jgi:D-alanine--poly(phosphoribitol) ligase subunit 2
MDKLLEILKDIKPDVIFSSEKKLIDNNVLDSFDIVQLVMKLNEEFSIEIGAEDIIPQNFNSAESLWLMIQKLQD